MVKRRIIFRCIIINNSKNGVNLIVKEISSEKGESDERGESVEKEDSE